MLCRFGKRLNERGIRKGNEIFTLEIRSVTTDDKTTKFLTVCKAYMNKNDEVKYKSQVALPTRHLDDIIKTLEDWKEKIGETNE